MSEQNKREEALSQETVTSEVAQKKAKSPAKKKEKKPNRLLRWLKDMRGELKKITWPTGKDTLKNVLIVIACVIVVGIFIWVFDAVAKLVINALINLFG